MHTANEQDAKWGRKAKLALAGVAMTGASMAMPRPAHAISEYLVNGGYATAGAAAASLVLRGIRGGESSAADTLLAPVPTKVYVEKRMPPKKMSKRELLSLLLLEISAWQKAAVVAVPAAALVGLIGATKRWVHVESLRLAQLEDGAEKSELSKKLATLNAELAKMTESSKEFETQLAEALEASAALEDKLAKAEADLKSANANLASTKAESEAAGEALMAAKAEAQAEAQKLADEAKAELEAQLAVTAELRRQLGKAEQESLETQAQFAAVEALKEAAEADAAKARLALEQELHTVKERLAAAETAEAAAVEALKDQEDWRKSREEWESETKAAFLALEQELKDTVAKLEAAEEAAEAAEAVAGVEAADVKEAREALEAQLAKVTARAEEAEQTMLEAREEAEAARKSATSEKEKRESLIEELASARSELKAITESMEAESEEAKTTELALSEAMADAQRLRDEMDAIRSEQTVTAAELADARSAMEKSMKENAESTASAEKIRDLKATHDAQMWEMECTIRALEETMVKAHQMARRNAERMLRHNETMSRVVNGRGEADIPVQFEIVVETKVGQRVAMVGSWNDWSVEDAFPMRWTEGNVWTVTTPIHADDTYEYKYVIIDDNAPDPLESAVWQYGNNRTLALQLSLHDDIVLVEVKDSWIPNPKAMPIMLHQLDGTVTEVGSTKLLRDCVRELRTEQALLDGSEYVRVLEEISTMTLGGGDAMPSLGAGAENTDDSVDVDMAPPAAAADELPNAAEPLEGDITVMPADGPATFFSENPADVKNTSSGRINAR